VLGGYIAATLEGVTTTSAGGSDYSAALVGAAVAAEKSRSDRRERVSPPTRGRAGATIPALYAEQPSSPILGPRCCTQDDPPAWSANPVRICNSQAPGSGDLVTPEGGACGTVQAIAYKAVSRAADQLDAHARAYGFLRGLFEVFERHQTVVDVVTTSEVSVSSP